jgi:hypothetical protein
MFYEVFCLHDRFSNMFRIAYVAVFVYIHHLKAWTHIRQKLGLSPAKDTTDADNIDLLMAYED